MVDNFQAFSKKFYEKLKIDCNFTPKWKKPKETLHSILLEQLQALTSIIAICILV